MISVVVPVYNVASYLPQCLDSLLSQTYKDLEIIIVSDGSTDDSSQICDSYATKDRRVKVVHKNLITQYDIIPYGGCNYAEDLYCVVKILYYAHSLTVVNQPLYHYCRRGDSLTASPKNEYYWNMRKANMDRICDF